MDRRFPILVLAASALMFAAVWFWTAPATPDAAPAIETVEAPATPAAIPAASQPVAKPDTTPLPPPTQSEIPR